jgi:phosphonatase-like hydrolase
MSHIQLVILDMAGTTVKDKNEVQQCFFNAAESTGLQADVGQINSMMGWSKKLVFQTLWQEQIGDDHPDYVSQVEISFTRFKEILEDHYRTQPVMPTEGCLDLFAWLKSQGIKIALNTGFYREVTNIILHRLGWDQGLNSEYVGTADSMIQASVTPSEIHNNEGRPAPFMIQKAMYRLGISNPQRVITIGDTPADIQAGMSAYCLLSLGVTNGTHTREELAKCPNDGLLDSLHDLQDRIVNL